MHASQLNHFEIKVEATNFFPDIMQIHLQKSLSLRFCSPTARLTLCLKPKKRSSCNNYIENLFK